MGANVQEATPTPQKLLSLSDKRTLVLAATMMATFMAAIESTIVATAMPTIVGDLGDFHLFSWVFAAYLLTQAVSIPIYGRLSDLYGRKPLFYVGAGLFLLGSILGGFAWGMIPLIAFRFIQGLGAGAVQPIAYVIVGDIYTPTERARVQGLLSSMFGISAVIGPAFGGLIVQYLSWSFIFWVNIPIGVIAIIMLAIFFQEPTGGRRHQVDYAGSLLLMIGGGALMTALVQLGHIDWQVVGVLIGVGTVAIAWFIVHERKAAEPILPLRLWRKRELASCNIASLAIGANAISVAGFLPTYVQGVMGYSPTVAGIAFGMTAITWSLAAFVAGTVMIRSSFRTAAMIGGAIITVGSAILALMTPQSGALWAAIGSAVIGVGLGFCNTTYLVAGQAVAEKADRGAATSAILFTRTVGQAVGAALFGAVINIGIVFLDPRLASAADRMLDPKIRSDFSAQDLLTLTTALGDSLRNVYILSALIGIAVLLLGRQLPAHPPRDEA
jgi:EmrB/QacA subfamily drug resistance transporter